MRASGERGHDRARAQLVDAHRVGPRRPVVSQGRGCAPPRRSPPDGRGACRDVPDLVAARPDATSRSGRLPNPVTSCSWFASAVAIALPMKPLAPVTAIFMPVTLPVRRGRACDLRPERGEFRQLHDPVGQHRGVDEPRQRILGSTPRMRCPRRRARCGRRRTRRAAPTSAASSTPGRPAITGSYRAG